MCGSSARTDLYGGRLAIAVPTVSRKSGLSPIDGCSPQGLRASRGNHKRLRLGYAHRNSHDGNGSQSGNFQPSRKSRPKDSSRWHPSSGEFGKATSQPHSSVKRLEDAIGTIHKPPKWRRASSRKNASFIFVVERRKGPTAISDSRSAPRSAWVKIRNHAEQCQVCQGPRLLASWLHYECDCTAPSSFATSGPPGT